MSPAQLFPWTQPDRSAGASTAKISVTNAGGTSTTTKAFTVNSGAGAAMECQPLVGKRAEAAWDIFIHLLIHETSAELRVKPNVHGNYIGKVRASKTVKRFDEVSLGAVNLNVTALPCTGVWLVNEKQLVDWDRIVARQLLPNRTRYTGKHVVRMASDQSDRPNDDHQNDCQHHRVFSDVLCFLLRPQFAKQISHILTPLKPFCPAQGC
jgi:hypothetical protein